MSHSSITTHHKTSIAIDSRSGNAVERLAKGATVRKLAIILVLAGCSDLSLDPPPKLVHARFDPDAHVIPMPTDVLRDKAAGHLDLTDARTPSDPPAATEFYDYLETLDGWSTLMSATVEFTGAIDPTTVGDGTMQSGHFGPR